MKTFVRLCRCVILRNKGFTAGIFVMSVLCAAIAFLGANFGLSSSDTVMNFIAESGTPDAVYLTDVLPEDTADRIGAVPGVKTVYPGFVYDTDMQTEDGSVYSVRLIRRDPSSGFIHTVREECSCDGTEPAAAISSEFAECNDVHGGTGSRSIRCSENRT